MRLVPFMPSAAEDEARRREVANCLGANFVGAIDLALVTSLRRLDASTCRVYRLRAEVVRHGWMGYGGTVSPEIAGNYDRVVSRVLWGSYGGGVWGRA